MESWPFTDSPNTASITTRQVLEGAPILLVTHDARVVGLGQMYRRDVTLGELADLPEGWRASRSAAGLPWHRSPA
jgi:hypothetical protein